MSTGRTAPAQRRIGCFIYNRSTFWSMLAHGVSTRAAEDGIAVDVLSATDVAGQSAALAQFVDQSVDGIVVGAIDPDEAARVLRRIAPRNLPVISVVAEMPASSVRSNVCVDDIGGATQSAEYLASLLDGQGLVAHFQGAMHVVTAVHRSDGFRNVTARYPDMRIVYEAQGTDWSYESGQRMMREVLASHPAVRGVFSASDPMALGALDVIAEAGRAKDISVVGFDGQPDALAAIFDGRLAATVDQPSYTIGHTAANAVLRSWGGEHLPPMITIPTKLITRENLSASVVETVRLMPGLFDSLMTHSETQRRLQETIITAQQALIQELSTPILPLTDDILALPLVGTIDSLRANRVTERLLNTIISTRARVVIIDISGVPVVDTGVANHLLSTASAARLLGTTTLLVGVSPEIAQTIVQLGINLSGVQTFSTMRAGLAFAMAHRGRR
jgi:ribose transport system substrate-binding protein